MAKSQGVKKIRCLFFDIPRRKCEEHNELRLQSDGKHMSGHVPVYAFNNYFNNLVPPTKKEGFTDIITIKYAKY